MRITDNMKFATVAFNLQKGSIDNFNATERVLTGKKINRPSDDPAGTQEVLHLKRLQSSVEQHIRNMDNSVTHLDMNETVLDRVEVLLSDARAIASTEHLSAQSNTRAGSALRVTEIMNEMMALANTQLDGKYIFAGFETSTQPVDPTAGAPFTYNGDTNDFQINIGEQRKIAINLNGDEIFGNGTGGFVNVFTSLDNLQTALQTDNVAGITAEISNLIQAKDQVTQGRIKNASRHETINANIDNLKSFKNNLLTSISNVEEVDMTEAVLEMQSVQTTMEVTYNATKTFMDSSLLNFLR